MFGVQHVFVINLATQTRFFLVHWKHTDFCQPLNQHSFGFQLLTMTPQELTDLTTLVKLSTGVAWQEWNAFCEMRHPLYSKFIEADGGTHGWWPESVCFLKEIDFWGTCFVHFRDVFFSRLFTFEAILFWYYEILWLQPFSWKLSTSLFELYLYIYIIYIHEGWCCLMFGTTFGCMAWNSKFQRLKRPGHWSYGWHCGGHPWSTYFRHAHVVSRCRGRHVNLDEVFPVFFFGWFFCWKGYPPGN